jgi:hypothetical protein
VSDKKLAAYHLIVANASMESHGHMALEYLQWLVDHNGSCANLDPLLCPIHADLSQRFNDQLKYMDDCREVIEHNTV